MCNIEYILGNADLPYFHSYSLSTSDIKKLINKNKGTDGQQH